MHSSSTPMSDAATPRRRVNVRTTLAAVIVGSLIGGVAGVATIPAAYAGAAGQSGTYEITSKPVELLQAGDPGMGTLTPTADAATNGMYGPQVAWPIIPLHVALARNGHLISYGTPLDSPAQGGLQYDDWDVAAGFDRNAHVDTASMHDYNSFCNSLVVLQDGRMLMVGGNSTMNTMIYDPVTRTQDMGQNLAQSRWYATTLRLTDNRILVLGGANYYNSTAYKYPEDNSGVATIPEIGTGTGAWTKLTGAASLYAFGAESNRWWYPRAYNAANGTVIGFSGDHIWSLDPTGSGSLQELGTLPYNPKVSGSQVMYAPNKILIAGGGQVINDEAVAASNAAAILDISGSKPVATSTTPMTFPRHWLNLTVLPNGEVFANGGTKFGVDPGESNSAKQAEIWNPGTGKWRTAATAQRTRTYHSVSLVLPSGAVFTGGGGAPGPEDNLNAELYYPAYLFNKGTDNKVTWASRPAIATIAGSGTYGGQLTLRMGDTRIIKAASLITAPSVTHAQNTDQRRVPLDITQSGGTITAKLPASAATMPPGDYELTVVDDKGVPSAAQMITIRVNATGLITVGAGTNVAPVSEPTVASTTSASPSVSASPTASVTPTASPTPSTSTTPTNVPTPSASPTAQPTATPTAATPTSTQTAEPTATPSTTPTAGPTVQPTPSTTVKPPVTSVPRKVGDIASFEARSRSGYLLSHTTTGITLRKVATGSSSTLRRQASWIVRKGLTGSGYAFESVDRRGYYLVTTTGGDGVMKFAKRVKTAAFAKRATFYAVTGATGKDLSLLSAMRNGHYVQTRGTQLRVAVLSKSKVGRTAATFLLRAGLSAQQRG